MRVRLLVTALRASLVARVGVAQRDEHAMPRELGDALGADPIGREREHDRTAIRLCDRRDIVAPESADVAGFTRTLAAGSRKGPSR